MLLGFLGVRFEVERGKLAPPPPLPKTLEIWYVSAKIHVVS